MRFQLGAMSVGDILDRGLKLVIGRLGTFYAVNLIPMAPVLLLTIIQPMLPQGVGILLTLLNAVLGIIVASVIQAATLRVIEMEHIDYQITVAQAFQFGLSKIVPMFLVTLAQGILFSLGITCCVVPGLLFISWYLFAGQVVVVENLGSGAALSRSKELTAGYRGRVWGFVLLIGLVYLAFIFAIQLGLNFLFPSLAFVSTPLGSQLTITNPRNHAITTVIAQLLSVPFAAYLAACATLFYFDLRVRKEGFDLELAARSEASPAEPI